MLALGFAGPLILVLSFATRFDLGADAPWYLLSLVANGYVPWVAVLLGLVWLAIAAQLAALVSGRYAAYPGRQAQVRAPQPDLVGARCLAGRHATQDEARGVGGLMRRLVRIVGTLMIVAGVGALAWAFTVWKWEDPFTATLNYFDQRQLAQTFDRRLEEGRPVGTAASAADVRTTLPRDAVAWRKSLKRGDAIARLRIPRLG